LSFPCCFFFLSLFPSSFFSPLLLSFPIFLLLLSSGGKKLTFFTVRLSLSATNFGRASEKGKEHHAKK